MRNWKFILGLLVITAFILTACGGGNTSANDVMANNNMGSNANMANNDMGHNDMAADNMADENMGTDAMSNDGMSHDNMGSDAMSNDGMSNDAMGNDSMSDDAMGTDNMSHDNMGSDSMGADAMGSDTMGSDTMGMDAPAWFDYEFVDARTGETFTINDFHGQVVMIETMAMWCSNCLKQQTNVLSFHQQLGERDDFVAIGLDIDTNEDLAQLAGYVNKNGFNWLYTIANEDIAAEVARTFGPQYLNPPSTPIVIIDKDGGIHTLPFGIKSADDLMGYVEMYLN